MAGKTIPISVRVTGEDSDFLAGLDVPGAATPSDKIRTLIREARLRDAGEQSYSEGLSYQEQQLAPLIRTLRKAEHDLNIHSELLVQFLNWLPETTAYLHVELRAGDSGVDTQANLTALEKGMAERLMGLLEACMRLAVTPTEPCYDSSCVRSKLLPILELSSLIKSSIIEKGEKQS